MLLASACTIKLNINTEIKKENSNTKITGIVVFNIYVIYV